MVDGTADAGAYEALLSRVPETVRPDFTCSIGGCGSDRFSSYGLLCRGLGSGFLVVANLLNTTAQVHLSWGGRPIGAAVDAYTGTAVSLPLSLGPLGVARLRLSRSR